MIIETLVTTRNPDGSTNIAPMGPVVTGDWSQFELRPFDSSQTFRNLQQTGEGIIHITDNVKLMAQAAIHQFQDYPEMTPGKRVNVQAIADSCRWFEFQVIFVDSNRPRVNLQCRTVFSHVQRDFVGFNRAKHAVLEASILATRVDFLPVQEIQTQFNQFEIVIKKTGGPAEWEAFEMLQRYVNSNPFANYGTEDEGASISR